MTGEVLLRAEGVSKKFTRSLRQSMKYGVADIVRDVLGVSVDSHLLRPHEFWSLHDVSFELRRGQCLGLIGRNGAGKSTLLKVMNGIMAPDTGRVVARGRVGALIEVGAGFHPQLTGRENIFVNASILGLSRRETHQRLDEIIAFSEVGEHIDAPVKFYSSGMYVRLGFAIAAHLRPDIMLIDEVLAVGDAGFRSKCYAAMDEMMQRTAVVFVSHNMEAVTRVCTEVVVLDGGRVVFAGEPTLAAAYYSQLFRQERELSGREGFELRRLQVDPEVPFGCPLSVGVSLYAPERVEDVLVKLNFAAASGQLAAEFSNRNNGIRIDLEQGENCFAIDLPGLNLLPQKYYLSFSVIRNVADHLLWCRHVGEIRVRGQQTGHQSYQLEGVMTRSEDPAAHRSRVGEGSGETR